MTKYKRPYQQVGASLRSEIAAGKFHVGDKLPTEREIAERLGVSRATVRDALIMLELEGLVEVRKGSGIYLVQLPDGQQTHPSEESAIDEIGPFELLQARILIEGNVAEFAASQVTINDIKKMQSALDAEKVCSQQGTDSNEADRDFHFAIAEATQNTALVEAVKTLWHQREKSQMWQVLHSHIIDDSYRSMWIEQHQRIFNAMKKKNPAEAKLAMCAHLESVKQTLLEVADVDAPGFDGYLFGESPNVMTR